jgi:hypothetical protein
MRKMTIAALATTLALATGCTAVKSGLSALGGGKPHNVTVVNNIEAPQPQVVVHTPAIVAQEPTPLAQLPRPKKSRLTAMKAVTSGAVAGALVGTAVGYAVGGSDGAAKGAALGAGAGAVGGAAAHQTR